MGRDFADTRDIDRTLARALARICEHMGAEGGALFLLEDEGRVLRCQASEGAVQIAGIMLPSDHGVIGRVVQSNAGVIVHDPASDPSFDGSIDARTGFVTRSILAAPLSVRENCIGAIELINKRADDGRFQPTDLALLEVLCSSAALAILNARLSVELAEQERVRREVELAAEIQRNLLPSPPSPDFPVFGLNIPARKVSGDFYDFFQLADGRIAFCLGDVSGKGINAALLMAKTASLYRCLGKEETSPGRLLARINDEIFETATRGMFVTLIGGVYNPTTDRLCFANAGHEPPLYQSRDGSFTDFPADAPPLGILPATGDRLPERELALGGGAFYIFTDGLTEGRRADGERLGVQGVKWALIRRRNRPLDERIEALAKLVARDDGAYHDDVTLLGIDGTRPTASVRAFEEDSDETLSYRFAARAENLQGARAAVREYLSARGVSEVVVNDIVLAIDEANQNIIRHAYGEHENGDIVLEMSMDDGELAVAIRDFAPPIDPAAVAPRPLDDVRPGGLGTHFMRSIMDEVAYLRPADGNGNLLHMRKRIGS